MFLFEFISKYKLRTINDISQYADMVVDRIDTVEEHPFATLMTPAYWDRRTKISDIDACKQNTQRALVSADRHENVCFDR